VVQSLNALTAQLRAAHVALGDGDLGAARTRIVEAMASSVQAMQDTRQVLGVLRPRSLAQSGFVEGLERTLKAVLKGTGVTLNLSIDPHIAPLPPQLEVELLRIAQEAARNAARHANTRDFVVTARGDDRRLQVVFEDNGVGFNASAATDGFGLIVMRERALRVGGELRVDAQPGQGTRIELDLPLGGVADSP
jgi:signal transduction histidine kinase